MDSPSPAQQLRVLTPELAQRISVVNAATRKLRDLGCSVVYQEFRVGEPRVPKLRLDRGDERLREQLRHVLISPVGTGARVITGRFHGVDVSYLEEVQTTIERCKGLGGERACCKRAGEYNGYGSGEPLDFSCPEHCPCHD